MKYKMIGTLQLAICWILTLHADISTAKPLDPEDVEGLLPPTPHDKNETIAAVVQDPVVQDAVHQTASNGSLNGLVVKRKVYILPASNPNQVLSKREHLLVVPTENLEDVRRNITEAKQAEAESMESSSPENQSFFEGDANDYTPENDASLDFQGNEGGPEQTANELPSDSAEITEQSVPVADNLKTKTEFLKDKLSHDAAAPEDDSKKVAVPIVAVIDPSNAEKGKVNTPIVAILPNQLDKKPLTDQVQFLTDNSDKIQQKAQNYIDQTSMTIDPDYWKLSTIPSEMAISTTRGTLPVSLLPEEASNLVTREMSLAPVAVPRWKMVAPVFPEDVAEYPGGTGDMDVAEDIIFRPLFRYRQESQERSRYRDDGGSRRYGYRYPDYNYYPRRGYYRPRYDDY